jgi:tetratricopeptide (TPR) repeat protein
MLEMLIDDGRLERSNDSWVAVGEMAEVSVPSSISSLLEARLDRLGPDERAVIERASVVGKVFYGGAIQALFGNDPPPNLRELVMGLVRRELVRAERSTLPGQEMYRFRHLLIRDAAYEGTPKELRAELHERFAAWLEDVAGERIEEQEEILAYHLEQAVELRHQLGPLGEREKDIGRRAALHLRDAGQRASDRGDLAAAMNLYERAVKLLPEGDGARADLLFRFGDALIPTERVRESVDVLEAALHAAAAAGDSRIECLARIMRSSAQTLVDPHAVSTARFRDEIREAIGVFESLDDEASQARAWFELAQTEWMPCRYRAAIEDLARARELAGAAGDLRTFDEATAMTAAALYFGPTSAVEAFNACSELLADVRLTPLARAGVTICRAGCQSMLGELDEAEEAAEVSERFFEDVGLPMWRSVIYERRGNTASMYGDAARAEAAYRTSFEILDEVGDQGHLSTAAASLAWALADLGRLEEAERFASIGREMAAADDVASQSGANAAWATVLSARGDLDGAIVAARRSISVAANSDMYFVLGDLHLNLARILARAGQRDEAVEAAREALSFFDRKGVVPAVARTEAFLVELGAGRDSA